MSISKRKAYDTFIGGFPPVDAPWCPESLEQALRILRSPEGTEEKDRVFSACCMLLHDRLQSGGVPAEDAAEILELVLEAKHKLGFPVEDMAPLMEPLAHLIMIQR